MLYTIESEQFGKIEIHTGTKDVYFFREDFCTTLGPNDTFQNWYGTEFRVHFNYFNKSAKPTLEYKTWRVAN